MTVSIIANHSGAIGRWRYAASSLENARVDWRVQCRRLFTRSHCGRADNAVLFDTYQWVTPDNRRTFRIHQSTARARVQYAFVSLTGQLWSCFNAHFSSRCRARSNASLVSRDETHLANVNGMTTEKPRIINRAVRYPVLIMSENRESVDISREKHAVVLLTFNASGHARDQRLILLVSLVCSYIKRVIFSARA